MLVHVLILPSPDLSFSFLSILVSIACDQPGSGPVRHFLFQTSLPAFYTSDDSNGYLSVLYGVYRSIVREDKVKQINRWPTVQLLWTKAPGNDPSRDKL